MPPRPRAAKAAPVTAVDEAEISNSFEELLKRCLDVKATTTDVTRMLKLKDHLQQIQWDSPESLNLKSQLVACFESRILYKSVQGTNFLATVMNLDPLLLGPIDEVLKKCLLAFPDSLMKPLSVMYLKAWQLSTGGMRIAIEHRIIEWMKRALFTPIGTAKRVRELLSELHTTQRTPEMNELLSRYYGPVLMRNTKVANWEVRFNAIALLCAAFPVMPPDRTQIEFEEKLTIQFRVLKDAMEDPNESVRRCAVSGSGRILRDFWEVLSIEQIALVLDSISQKAARDKSSARTRQAAIAALALVIDNPLSHGVMNEVLPGGCAVDLLNDTNPAVRLKFGQLLLKLSRLSTFQIPRFIDQGVLLAQIATEHALAVNLTRNSIHAQISSLLTSIVAPSLFAMGNGVEDQVTRCERLAEALPQALVALTANCAEATSEVDRVRLAVALSTRVVKLVSTGDSMRKQRIAQVLLQAASELMRNCPSLAGVQGTETDVDSDAKKLADFIYRYITDRETDRFVELCASKQLELLGDLIVWLSLLDGTRLPQVYARVCGDEAGMLGSSVLAVNWGITANNPVNVFKTISSSISTRSFAPGLDSAVSSLLKEIDLALSMNRLDRIDLDQITGIVRGISGAFPNVKFVPRIDLVLRKCLVVILKLVDANELVSNLHPLNIGLIQSLNIAPIGAAPVGKRAKSSKTTQAQEMIEYSLSGGEMVEFIEFYLSFLLCAHLVTEVSLKVLKFEEIAKVWITWIHRAGLSKEDAWERLERLIVQSMEGLAGPAATFALFEGILDLETVEFPTLSRLEALLAPLCENFTHTHEMSALIMKLSITREHARVHQTINQFVGKHSDVGMPRIDDMPILA